MAQIIYHGIVGYISGSQIEIRNCNNDGNISGNRVGGILGGSPSANQVHIENCNNECTIRSSGSGTGRNSRIFLRR